MLKTVVWVTSPMPPILLLCLCSRRGRGEHRTATLQNPGTPLHHLSITLCLFLSPLTMPPFCLEKSKMGASKRGAGLERIRTTTTAKRRTVIIIIIIIVILIIVSLIIIIMIIIIIIRVIVIMSNCSNSSDVSNGPCS